MAQVLCPVLVGRDQELAGLRHLWEAAGGGSGGVVVVVGEAGTGKTRLVRDLVSLARLTAGPALVGRAVETGLPVPYRPLAEALLSAVRRGLPALGSPELEPFRAVLGPLVPDWRRPEQAADSSSVLVGEGLLRVLRHLGRSGGCLLVLEDLHWADPDTLAVVEYLADNLTEEPALLVATVRPEEADAGHALPLRLQARRSAGIVELGRLDQAGTLAMAQACLGLPTLPGELARVVWERSEGVPFLVEEVLAALVASGALHHGAQGWSLAGGIEHVVPASFAEAVGHRLASLGPRSAQVLRAAAVLGATFEWRLLGGMTGLGDLEVLAELRRAVDAQLLQPESTAGRGGGQAFRFRHALTAEALAESLLPPERAELARGALDALERAGPRLPQRWQELAGALAEAAGERQRAAQLWLATGRRAASLGALATAEANLLRARELAEDPATSLEVDEALVAVLVAAGRSDEALELGAELPARLAACARAAPARAALAPAAPAPAAPAPAAPTLADRELSVHLHLAGAAAQAGRPELAAAHLAAGRRLARHHGDHLARLHVTEGQVALPGGDTEAAAAAARAALGASRQSETLCQAWMLLGRALRTEDLTGAGEAFGRATELAAGPGLGLLRMHATHELGTIDLFTTNRVERLEQARQLAVAAGALGTLAAVDLHLAVAAQAGGKAAATIERAGGCVEVARRLGLEPLVAIGLAVQADAEAMRGRRREVERLAEEVLALPGATADARSAAWGARARCSLNQEDHARAARELAAAAEEVGDQGRTTAPGPHFGHWALLAALAGDDARRVVDRARALGAETARWNRGLLGYAEAVLAGRAGQPGRAAELAAEAEEALAVYPGFGYLGLRLLGQAAVEDGWGDPGRWLREVVALAEESGWEAMAGACRSLLRRAGIPLPRRRRCRRACPAGLDGKGITDRELEVLSQVGTGRSNAEIAEQLYLSPRTVEKHVEALLRKTGVSRRTQLAALVARAAQDG